MKILIAPDSFKGSLTAKEASTAIASAFTKVFPGSTIISSPMADGGEGSLSVLATELYSSTVQGPLGDPVEASWGTKDSIAIIESAEVIGLSLTLGEKHPAYFATTAGIGVMIKKVLDEGFKNIYLTLGGSSTNDCGIGAFSALGAKFLDDDLREVLPTPNSLKAIRSIDLKNLDPRLESTKLHLITDVKNPLTGPIGATHTYGLQKGLQKKDLESIDNTLLSFLSLIEKDSNKPLKKVEGLGAAGGLPLLFYAYLDAQIAKGAEFIGNEIELEKHIKDADLIITSEGSFDKQSRYGKTVSFVAFLAKKHRKLAVLFAGKIDTNFDELKNFGIKEFFCIKPDNVTASECVKNAEKYQRK